MSLGMVTLGGEGSGVQVEIGSPLPLGYDWIQRGRDGREILPWPSNMALPPNAPGEADWQKWRKLRQPGTPFDDVKLWRDPVSHENNVTIQNEYPINSDDEHSVIAGWQSWDEMIASKTKFDHSWITEQAWEIAFWRELVELASNGLEDELYATMSNGIKRKMSLRPNFGFQNQWITLNPSLVKPYYGWNGDDWMAEAWRKFHINGRYNYTVGRIPGPDGHYKYFFITEALKNRFSDEGKLNYAEDSGRVDDNGDRNPVYMLEPPATAWDTFKSYVQIAGGVVKFFAAFYAITQGDFSKFGELFSAIPEADAASQKTLDDAADDKVREALAGGGSFGAVDTGVVALKPPPPRIVQPLPSGFSPRPIHKVMFGEPAYAYAKMVALERKTRTTPSDSPEWKELVNQMALLRNQLEGMLA